MRLIARLDIKNNHVVKGIHLEGLRKVGDPCEMALKYTEPRVDELLFMDAVASLYDRNSLFPVIAKACENVFIPVTVGGGIRTLDDIQMALRSGADKVAINTQAVRNPDFIRQASERFGSQAIVASIEALGREVYINNGRDRVGKDVAAWAVELAGLGAGEILLTSIEKEGTRKGFNVALAQEIDSLVSVPVVVCGGLGLLSHLDSLPKGVSVACASVLHYNILSVSDIRGRILH
jgi:cyclase